MNNKLIKLTFVGDIMCDYDQLKNLKTENSHNFNGVFKAVESHLNESDYVVGNLETPVAGSGAKYSFEKYRMNAPIEFAEAIKKSGVDLVSTANNHSLDRGVDGLKNTIKNLDRVKLEHIGTYLDKGDKHYIIKNISGVKIAFLSYTYGTNAFDNGNYLKKSERYLIDLFQNQELSGLLNRIVFSNSSRRMIRISKRVIRRVDPLRFSKEVYEVEESSYYWRRQLRRDIKSCRKQADFIVMLAHIGGQYNSRPSNFTKRIAKWLMKNGVDTIICNHEHVIHPIEVKGDNVTAYALGNFFGTGGSISAPFDKKSEYSLFFNTYIDPSKKEKTKYTFSICKTILDPKGKLKNVLLYDLIEKSKAKKEKKELMRDNEQIVEDVTGTKLSSIMKEYTIG